MADENNRKKNDQPPEGFFTNIFRPWKRQRVTLTPLGKGAEPKAKGRAKKTKKVKGKKTAAAKKTKKAVAKQTAPQTSARQRQINELKTLAKIGKRDPERLVAIIAKMLLEDEEQARNDRLRFERLIWEKAEKRNPDEE